jgi:hypothetical protein
VSLPFGILLSLKEADMKCRIGDLAILVRPEVPQNLGLLVEVVRVWRNKPGYWWVRSLSGPCKRDDGTVAAEGMCPDRSLRPIRGDKPRRSRQSKKKAGTTMELNLTA